ncbi:MAG: heavy-metal-associated domain-containing protein [Gammaproteobacteria bacterium]|nr:heavy-metal-associated domain-containing protein [Gammaproteobacteria bacterium]
MPDPVGSFGAKASVHRLVPGVDSRSSRLRAADIPRLTWSRLQDLRCQPRSTCDRRLALQTRIRWALAAVLSAAAPWLLAAPLRPAAPAPAAAKTDADAYVLRVDGLACPFCAYGIEKQFSTLPAVTGTDVDLAQGAVIVHVKPGARLTRPQIENTVKQAGFSLKGIVSTPQAQ